MSLLLVAILVELTDVGFFEAGCFFAGRDGMDFFMGGPFQRIRPIADLAPPKAPRSGGAYVLPVEPVITRNSNASFAAEVEGI